MTRSSCLVISQASLGDSYVSQAKWTSYVRNLQVDACASHRPCHDRIAQVTLSTVSSKLFVLPAVDVWFNGLHIVRSPWYRLGVSKTSASYNRQFVSPRMIRMVLVYILKRWGIDVRASCALSRDGLQIVYLTHNQDGAWMQNLALWRQTAWQGKIRQHARRLEIIIATS